MEYGGVWESVLINYPGRCAFEIETWDASAVSSSYSFLPMKAVLSELDINSGTLEIDMSDVCTQRSWVS